MTARYSSKCSLCKKGIVPGAPIAMHKGRGVHLRCMPAGAPKPQPKKPGARDEDANVEDELEAALARI